jgi:hypothetical protein
MNKLYHVIKTEIHTAEPPVPEPGASEDEMTIEKLNRHKSPGTDQIPAELIKAGAEQSVLRSKSLLILNVMCSMSVHYIIQKH